MAFHWRADDGPLLPLFGSSLTSLDKKKYVRDGPSLAELSGSAHILFPDLGNTCIFILIEANAAIIRLGEKR